MRGLARHLLRVLAVLLLLSAALAGLVATEAGTRALLAVGARLVPGELSIGRVDGRLIDRLQLSDLRLHHPRLSLAIGQLRLQWQPWALLRGQLWLRRLELDGLDYSDHGLEADETAWDPATMRLPLELMLEQGRLRTARLALAPGAAPLQLAGAELRGRWGAAGLQLDQLALRGVGDRAGDGAGDGATLDGSVQFDGQSFATRLRWSHLQWPLSGEPAYRSRSGELSASGRLAAWTFTIGAAISGDSLPPGQWRGQGKGDADGVDFDSLQFEAMNGELQASGRLDWSPALAWRAQLHATGVDPGLLFAGWDGALDLSTAVHGQWSPQGPWNAAFEDITASGTLRGQPLRAGGGLRLDADGVGLERVELHSGQARVQADGRLDPDGRWDLAWGLDVPRLDPLLPDAGGRIEGSGRLWGSALEPGISGQLSADRLSWRDLRVGRLRTSFALSAADQDSRVQLDAAALAWGAQAIDSLSLHGSGPPARQRLTLDAASSDGHLGLRAGGSWRAAQRRWDGQLEAVDLSAGELGHWRLQQAAALTLTPDRATLAESCLQQESARLCAELDWRSPVGPPGVAPDAAGAGKASVRLSGLSLERLHPWLSADIVELTGLLEMSLNAELGAASVAGPVADLLLAVGPGTLGYLIDFHRRLQLEHQGGELRAVLDAERLTAVWRLAVGDNHLNGNLALPREPLERDISTAPLSGRLELALRQVGLIDAFVPWVYRAEGDVRGTLDLAGSLGDPRVSGAVKLEAERALIPDAGLELTAIHLGLHGDGSDRLRISGGLSSGPGQLTVDGSVTLDAARGWPMSLQLDGQRAQVLTLPQVSALASPSLRLTRTTDRFELSGRVRVPEAAISLHSLPSTAQSASSDVVMVSSKAGATAPAVVSSGPRLSARVDVVLGDRVRLRGFGLDGRLSGDVVLTREPGRFITAKGELGVRNATLFFLGERLDVERGRLLYVGGALDAPGLDLRASREVDNRVVGVNLTGTLDQPRFVGFSSDPSIGSRDALGILATGQSPDDPGFDQAVRATIASLGASALANPVTRVTGLDQLSLRSGEDPRDASVYAGKNLNQNLNVGVSVDVDDPSEQSEFVTRYKLRPNLHLEARSSAQKSGLELKYVIEFK